VASVRWRPDSVAVVPGPPSTATISTRGPRADPPACKISSLPARDATGRKAPGSPRPHSRTGWNDDGGTTSRPTVPSASANGSRSAESLSPTTALPAPQAMLTVADGARAFLPCPPVPCPATGISCRKTRP
jgi:hypothetical protein